MGFKQESPVNGAVASNNNLTNQAVHLVDNYNKLHSAAWVPNASRTLVQAITLTVDIWRNGVKLCTAFTLTLAAASSYVAQTAYFMTPTTTFTQLLCSPGDVLVYAIQQGATGQAVDGGLIMVKNGQQVSADEI